MSALNLRCLTKRVYADMLLRRLADSTAHLRRGRLEVEMAAFKRSLGMNAEAKSP